MKLYAFQPNGHGPTSFFVMAKSKVDAIAKVDKFINGNTTEYIDSEGWGCFTGDDAKYSTKGDEYGDYTITDHGADGVATNDND